MKLIEISDDSCFLGIANYDKYQSFIGDQWNFDIMPEKIINEINSHNLLFWNTGMENSWIVNVCDKFSTKEFYREGRGVIEVTDNKLYVTNYEALTMAAQFNHVSLPEHHHKDLFFELDNGKYMVKFRQLMNPHEINVKSINFDFEIELSPIINMPEIYVNNVKQIYWFGD